MEQEKKILSNNSNDKNFSSQEIDDLELHEIAEKLEKELGHQYFSKPLDYTNNKKENKPTELLELEQEIANLGKIVLPSANLNPAQELSAPIKTNLHSPTGKGGKKLKKSRQEKTLSTNTNNKYQNFKLYPLPKKNIPTTGKKHNSFKISNDENLANWKKSFQTPVIENQNSEINNKEDFWELMKKEKQSQELEKKILREQEKEKIILAKKMLTEEKEKKTLAEKETKEKEKLLHQQAEEAKNLAKIEAKKQKALADEQTHKIKDQQFIAWQKEKESQDLKKKLAKLAQKENRQKEKIAKKIAHQKEREKNRNSRPLFAWYLARTKKPILYLVAIELILYFFSAVPLLTDFILNTLLNYLIIVDIFIFAWLTIAIRRHFGESSATAIKAVLMTGILVGFFRALFRIFWFSENWTLINIIVEPMIWGFYGLIIATLFSLIIKKNDNQNGCHPERAERVEGSRI